MHRSISFTAISLIAVHLIAAGPASAASPKVGTLTLFAGDAPGHIQPPPCPAVLVAAETVLVQATCFDSVRFLLETDKSAVEGQFILHDGGVAHEAAMLGQDIPSNHVVVQCGMGAFAEACSKAQFYCNHRFSASPIMRNACLYDSAFYARTFIDAPSNDLAVVYLNRRIDALPSPIADMFETWPAHSQWLILSLQDGSQAQQKPNQVTADAFWVHHTAGLRFASAAWLENDEGELGLAAFPSHFKNLPLGSKIPIDYVLTRLDINRPWIEAAMAHACLQRRRLDCSLPKTLMSHTPSPDPILAPAHPVQAECPPSPPLVNALEPPGLPPVPRHLAVPEIDTQMPPEDSAPPAIGTEAPETAPYCVNVASEPCKTEKKPRKQLLPGFSCSQTGGAPWWALLVASFARMRRQGRKKPQSDI